MVATRKNRAARRLEQGKGRRVLTTEQKHAICQRQRGIDESAPPGPEPAPHLPAVDSRGYLKTFAASEPWIEEQFSTIKEETPDGSLTSHQFTPSVVPAGFRRCRRCGHLSPPICISAKGYCVDCRFEELDRGGNLPGSTSSMSMAKIRRSRAKGDDFVPGGM